MLLIRAKNFSKQIGDKVLFDNIDFLVHSNDKIGLCGKNGSGKTTLLNEIYSNFELKENKDLRIGYLQQNINSESNVLEFILGITNPNDWFDHEVNTKRQELNILVEKIKLDPKLLEKNLDLLSGGEKTKAFILKVMLQKPELLILDEPTNHLDLTGINYLIQWLNEEYSGAFIVVSHNRDFLNKVTNRIFEIFNKQLSVFEGNYAYYKQEKEKQTQKQYERYADYQKDKKRLENTIQEKKQKMYTIEPKLARKREKQLKSGAGRKFLRSLL